MESNAEEGAAAAAEQRANAVAKLRRAASLPRMKDGRRPPMHGEAGGVSEGERSQGEEKKDGGGETGEAVSTPEEEKSEPVATTSGSTSAKETSDGKELERSPTPAESVKGSDGPTKRRSRSRSRSRGSKDLRAKMRALEMAPSSVPSDGPDESSPGESPPLSPPAIAATLSSAYLMQLQQMAAAQQPLVSPIGPLSPFTLGTPPPGAPGSLAGMGGMPSLQALQSRHLQGLFRSNSAAARMMAMRKLMGEPEPLDIGDANGNVGAGPASAVTPPSHAHSLSGSAAFALGGPGVGRGSRLARNNTVAGEERVAARQQLLRRLNERIQEKSDVETTSGPEDTMASTKRNRRRSRRKSGSSAVVDDREFAAGMGSATAYTTAVSTPTATPAMISLDDLPPPPRSPAPLIALPPSRAPSVPLEQMRRTPDLLRQHTPVPVSLSDPRRTPDPVHRAITPNPRSQTPNLRSQTPNPRTPTPVQHAEPNYYQYDSPIAHRGLVVEEDDLDVPMRLTPPPHHRSGAARIPGLPTPPSGSLTHTPVPGAHMHLPHLPPLAPMRVPHASDAPSLASTSSGSGSGSGAASVPVILSDPEQRSPYRQDVFPKSPFGTPIKERAPAPREEEEERVLYGAADGARARFLGSELGLGEREISWIADPVPVVPRRLLEEKNREISWDAEAVPEARLAAIKERDVSWVAEPDPTDRMPVYDEDEEDDDDDDDADDEAKEVNVEDTRSSSQSHSQSRRTSPRDSGESQEVVLERDPILDNAPSLSSAPSQESTTSTATMNTNARESAISDLSGTSGPTGDTSSRLLDRTHSQADSILGWSAAEGGTELQLQLSSKRSADSTSTSAWSKVKSTFARSGSSLGRRSRTNSIAREKKENTESSRESGASVVSGKRESKGDGGLTISWQQSQTPLSPSPTTSTSMLSLPPPPRGGVSPIPPPSDTDAARYMDPKLFPFPGMVKLQEENLRTRGMSLSASSPDIVLQPSTSGGGASTSANSSMSGQPQDGVRERRISHQASDSRLLPKYQMTSAQTITATPSSASQIDYFNIPQPPPANSNPSNDLPFTREGVKKWLSKRFFPSTSQQGESTSTPPLDSKVHAETIKKPSLSDLLGRKDIENISDWDDIDKTLDKPRAATSTSTSTVQGRSISYQGLLDNNEISESSPDDPMMAYQFANSFPLTPQQSEAIDTEAYDAHESRHLSAPLSSSHDPSSATPDPASSEESPSQSSHRSRSSMGSIYSPQETSRETAQATDILQRLDHVLRADVHNKLWTSALNSPPRRLLLSSPMLQVANCNTVKDRFLFLFSDVLVIAKPMLPDRDSLLDNQKLYPPDRKFFVKNVVHLKDIRLNVDRDDDANKPTSALVSQRPEFLRNFVQEFAENADAAIARIIDIKDPKGSITLGQLLVQLPEIDRAKLGEYLSRRTSKHVLKAYLDAYGFIGMNIDTSLRIFLLSIHMPSGSGHANTLETLLDTFATRWYEANAGIVAFDRDLAVRLVRAVVRLNEALHSPIAQDTASANFSRPHVSSRDFTEAFRRHDPRGLVPDSALEKIYASVRHEKLCQARNPTNGRAPNPVTLKRPVPSRVTYKRQSEPIVVRIPQVDAQLTIHLYGQDLVFEPPVLTFSKSSEASFRVTGNALGQKTMIMASSGPNAPNFSGLPLSTTISVERAFMRNTFQIAFANDAGIKRKYMFSVDDPVIRHEWTGSLKRQIETAKSSPDPPTDVQANVYRAAEELSFKVLQDTLLAPDTTTPNGTARRSATHGRMSSDTSQRHDSAQYGAATIKENYQRSQSRSQMYHLGAGKHEHELTIGADERQTSGLDILDEMQPTDARYWTGSELELLCQQNSSIPLILALLQAALPYDVDDELNTSFQFPPPIVQRHPSQSSSYQI